MSAKRRRSRNKGSVLCVGIIVIAFLSVMSIQAVRLNKKSEAKQEEYEEKQKQLEAEQQRSVELDEYEVYVNSPEYIEDIAKSKLGLAYENEIIFKESK